MPGLRVFENSVGRMLLEITSREIAPERALFVAAIPASYRNISVRSDDEFVAITWRNPTYLVPFLAIVRGNDQTSSLRFVGELEDTDSFNILNNLVDVLAYPSAFRF